MRLLTVFIVVHNYYVNNGEKAYQPTISGQRWRVKERLFLLVNTPVQDRIDCLTMQEAETYKGDMDA